MYNMVVFQYGAHIRHMICFLLDGTTWAQVRCIIRLFCFRSLHLQVWAHLKNNVFFDTGPDRLYKIYKESVSHFGPDGLIWIT